MSNLSFNIQPQTTSKTISTAYLEYIVDDQLNRKPAYQRSPVWTNDQKTNLIDSIMRNIPMPIFLIYSYGNTSECIDGQNRLTTIKQFIEQRPPPEGSDDKELEPFPWVVYNGESKENIFFEYNATKNEMKEWIDKKNQSKTKKKSKTVFRFMTTEEMRKFKGYELTFSIIKERLEYEQRKEIFSKWQSGTGISYCDKYKNEDYPFQEFVQSRNLELSLAPKVASLLKSGRKKWFLDIFHLIYIFLPDLKDEQIFPFELQCKNIIEKHEFNEKVWDEALSVTNKFITKVSCLQPLKNKMKLSCLLGIARLWSDPSKIFQSYLENNVFIQEFALESLNTESHQHSNLNSLNLEKGFREGFKLMKDLCLQKISLLLLPPTPSEPYKKHASVSPAKKQEIWNTYIGLKIGQVKCFICKTNEITQTTCEMGHIVPEKLGGTLDVSNLRPICKTCNGSQGILHMKAFIDKNFPGREILKAID